jgi:site-specific DNA-methyltransferase (adenine-specific)
MKLYWQSACGRYKIYNSAAGEIVPDDLPPIDALVTDPPYEIGFMGHGWDSAGVSFNKKTWEQVLSKLKPGAHGLVFGGCRTFHRIAVAAEDAGFDLRDTLMWVTGQGFPKGLNISKAIDAHLGLEREVVGHIVRGDVEVAKNSGSTIASADANKNNKSIFGYGVEKITKPASEIALRYSGFNTNLKPAYEPILLLRKPVEGTIAENVITHGVGGINIGACRVGTDDTRSKTSPTNFGIISDDSWKPKIVMAGPACGRWPANFLHDGSEDVLDCFPDAGGQQGDLVGHNKDSVSPNGIYGSMGPKSDAIARIDESKSAARFFYCAKVSKKERNEGMGDSKNNHVTVKPQGLMQFCNRLICPPGGIILDPFLGSGSTMVAAVNQGFSCIGVDISEEYCEIAKRRVEHALKKLGDDVDEKSKISSTKQSPVPLDNTIQPKLLLL